MLQFPIPDTIHQLEATINQLQDMLQPTLTTTTMLLAVTATTHPLATTTMLLEAITTLGLMEGLDLTLDSIMITMLVSTMEDSTAITETTSIAMAETSITDLTIREGLTIRADLTTKDLEIKDSMDKDLEVLTRRVELQNLVILNPLLTIPNSGYQTPEAELPRTQIRTQEVS
jgi:hypothetical protein